MHLRVNHLSFENQIFLNFMTVLAKDKAKECNYSTVLSIFIIFIKI